MSYQEINVENKILNNIIPTTKKWGVVSAIGIGVGLFFSGQIITAVLVPIIYYSSVMAFLVLLEGYAEIIALLRKIAETNSIPIEILKQAHPLQKERQNTIEPNNSNTQNNAAQSTLSIPNYVIAKADISTAENCIEFLRQYNVIVTEVAPGRWSIASPNNNTAINAYSVSDLRQFIVSLKN